jgi:hypothetical protein
MPLVSSGLLCFLLESAPSSSCSSPHLLAKSARYLERKEVQAWFDEAFAEPMVLLDEIIERVDVLQFN